MLARRAGTFLAAAGAAFFAAALAASQPHTDPLPGQTPIRDLELTSQYAFELDGEDLDDAEIYFSKRRAVFLVTAPALPAPLLISARGHAVQTLRADKVARGEGLRASVDEQASGEYLGRYESRSGELVFELAGRPAKLKPRPPLIGRQSASAVRGDQPHYELKARAWQASESAAALQSLPVGGDEIRVRVYFATWSPACEILVPQVMRLEEELRGSGIRFEYYGLPRPLIDDPVARQEGIYGVPTAVVYRNDEEIGRLRGPALDPPDEALYGLLTGASPVPPAEPGE